MILYSIRSQVYTCTNPTVYENSGIGLVLLRIADCTLYSDDIKCLTIQMDSTDKHKICISAIYRDTSKSIENFVWHHDEIGFDAILIIDTTGTMSEKMITHKFSTTKVMFIPLGSTEAASTDSHLVSSVVIPHCKKHCFDWLIHLSIDDRIDLNGNYGDIHTFLKCKPDCDGMIILKVKPKCTCKGEARCITRVKCTTAQECEWRWKYSIKNPTIIRATTNEICRHGDYDRHQSVVRSKSGRSIELVQIVHCSYIDSKNSSWSSYLKSFVVSAPKTDDEEHDKECILFKTDDSEEKEKEEVSTQV